MPKKNLVSFDEENLIENNEYFKENPCIIKIDEPKTPFHKDVPSFNFEDENSNQKDIKDIKDIKNKKN